MDRSTFSSACGGRTKLTELILSSQLTYHQKRLTCGIVGSFEGRSNPLSREVSDSVGVLAGDAGMLIEPWRRPSFSKALTSASIVRCSRPGRLCAAPRISRRRSAPSARVKGWIGSPNPPQPSPRRWQTRPSAKSSGSSRVGSWRRGAWRVRERLGAPGWCVGSARGLCEGDG